MSLAVRNQNILMGFPMIFQTDWFHLFTNLQRPKPQFHLHQAIKKPSPDNNKRQTFYPITERQSAVVNPEFGFRIIDGGPIQLFTTREQLPNGIGWSGLDRGGETDVAQQQGVGAGGYFNNLLIQMKEVSHEMEIKKKTPGTIILRVNRISEVKQSLSKLQVLISNDTNLQLSTQVHDVKKLYAELKAGDSSHEWQQAYFYNTHDMPDDNITFSLHEVTADGPNEEPLSRVTRHNLSNLIDPRADSPLQDTIEFRSKGGDLLALLSLTLEFFIRKDIIAGLEMPKIDLTPPQGFKPLYNAVDLYRPPSKVEGTEKLTAAQKYNCFNFFDGDEIPGFDQIDVFPAKFREVNKDKKDKQKTGIFSVWEE